MFLLVSVHHVGAHPGELQHGVSIQISTSLGKTFLRISRIRNIPLTWILARVFAYLPPFISQILDFIYWTVLILTLMYFEWRDTENQQLFCKIYYLDGLAVSTILSSLDSKYLDQLKLYLYPALQNPSRSKFVRCWHAKTDGWAVSTFHSNCDGKGPTVTIVQVGSYIFGGYTDKSWSSPSKY